LGVLVRAIATANVDITFALLPPDVHLPRVAADLAVLHQRPVNVWLDVHLTLLAAIGTNDSKFIH
jgi:hypothetical protein